MFFLDRDDTLVSSGDLHKIMDTSEQHCWIFVDLSDVVCKTRLALGSVYEDVAMIKNRLVFLTVVDLDICRESCSALSDDACLFDHFEV